MPYIPDFIEHCCHLDTYQQQKHCYTLKQKERVQNRNRWLKWYYEMTEDLFWVLLFLFSIQEYCNRREGLLPYYTWYL